MRQTKWKQKQVKRRQEQPVELPRHDLKLGPAHSGYNKTACAPGSLMAALGLVSGQGVVGTFTSTPGKITQMWEGMFTGERYLQRADILYLHTFACGSVAGASWWYAALQECVFGVVHVLCWALPLCWSSQAHFSENKMMEMSIHSQMFYSPMCIHCKILKST